MIKLEFHCHTHASKDSLTRPVDLIAVARRRGIDRLVITDHNSIAGAREAQAIDPELIIVGEEIMTTQGEILAAFVQEEIPAGLSPLETIVQLKAQGAFISVSHPFDELREGGWMENDLLEILPLGFNLRARAFAERHDLAGTVGSDAHAAFEVGRSLLLLDQFSGADGLRKVIRTAKMQVKWSPWWFHLTSRYASMKKKKQS